MNKITMQLAPLNGAVAESGKPLQTLTLTLMGYVVQGQKGDPGVGLPAGGATGQVPAKKSGADFDIEWRDPAAGVGGTWGTITGTLGDQTDLAQALAGKSDTGHNHDGVYVKPASLAAVATSGSYADLSGKPSIPAAQVNVDWSAASGVAQILNKPALGSAASASTGDFATAAQGAKADTALQAADITGKLDKTGGTMTGAISFAGAQTWPTFNQNTTGSAAKLTTSRTINGTGFDGTGNITTANWGTSRTLTIGSKGYSVNGSGNVTWTLADIGAAATVHSHSGATTGAAGFMSAADKTKLDGIAAGGSIAPGTIQYFADDPGAGWLKCDGSTYLRSSYADLSDELPVNLLHSPWDGPTSDYSIPSSTKNLLVKQVDAASQLYAAIAADSVALSFFTLAGATATNVATEPSASWHQYFDIWRDGDAVYVACQRPPGDTANYFGIMRYSISAKTFTKTSSVAVSGSLTKAAAFINGGANVVIYMQDADPVSGARMVVYDHSAGVLSNPVDVLGWKATGDAHAVGGIKISPDGRYGAVNFVATDYAYPRMFRIDGATITPLTQRNANAATEQFAGGFISNDTYVDYSPELMIHKVVDGVDVANNRGAYINTRRYGCETPWPGVIITARESEGAAMYELDGSGMSWQMINYIAHADLPITSGSSFSVSPDGTTLFTVPSSGVLRITKPNATQMRVPMRLGHYIKT